MKPSASTTCGNTTLVPAGWWCCCDVRFAHRLPWNSEQKVAAGQALGLKLHASSAVQSRCCTATPHLCGRIESGPIAHRRRVSWLPACVCVCGGCREQPTTASTCTPSAASAGGAIRASSTPYFLRVPCACAGVMRLRCSSLLVSRRCSSATCLRTRGRRCPPRGPRRIR